VLDNDDVVAFRVNTVDNTTYIKDLVVDALTIDDPTLTFSNAIVTGNFTVNGADDADKVRVLDGANVLVMGVNTNTNETYIKDLNVADTTALTTTAITGPLSVGGANSSTKVVVKNALLDTAFSINTSTQETYIKDLVVDKITLDDPTIAFDSATLSGTFTVSGADNANKLRVIDGDGIVTLRVDTTNNSTNVLGSVKIRGGGERNLEIKDSAGADVMFVNNGTKALIVDGVQEVKGAVSTTKFQVLDDSDDAVFKVDTNNSDVFINGLLAGSVIQKFTIAQGTTFTTNAGDRFPPTTGNTAPPLFDEAYLSPWTTFPVGTIISAHFKYTTDGYTYSVPMGLWNTYGFAGDTEDGSGTIWIGYIQRETESVNQIQFFIPNKLAYNNNGFYNMCVQGFGDPASLTLKGTIEVIVLRLVITV
jgi:hypothetical protein